MLRKTLLVSLISCLGMANVFAAPQILSATTAVNVTSETAAAAKNIAFDNARRTIVRDALAPYADGLTLVDAIKNASASELTNLIASSSIDGEQQSATTYSANITMTLDNTAVRKWLADNNIGNRLQDSATTGQILIQVTLRDRTADWMQLNQIARGENVEFNVRNIIGSQMTVSVPETNRKMFLAAVRSAGWQVADDGGIIRLWK